MNTAIRKLPQGLGAGFAKSMPAQNSKHLELMRLLDSQVDEHLGWSIGEPPVPSKPGADDPQPSVMPDQSAGSNPGPADWDDTVFEPSNDIDVTFTEPDIARANTPARQPPARPAWQFIKASLPWLMLLWVSIPVTVWLTLEWSDHTPGAAAAVVEKPKAEPSAKVAPMPVVAAAQAGRAPAEAAAIRAPVAAAAQSSPAMAPTDMPAAHDGGAVAEVAMPSTNPQPIDPAACAAGRAALGLCGAQNGRSTTIQGVKP